MGPVYDYFCVQNEIDRFEVGWALLPVPAADGQKCPSYFKLVVQHSLVLETGHSSADECLILIRAARKAGVKKILVTHAMADPIGMTIDQMKQASRM